MYIMTRLKRNFSFDFPSHVFTLLLIVCSFLTINLSAQEQVPIRFSVAASVGYAPQITMGSDNNSGVVVGVYGEMEYGNLIGRLQFTKPSLGTFKEDSYLDGGEAYHGSLGYRLDVNEQFSVAIMASGGATVIHYTVSIFGSRGDQFTNVSPQVGINIAPTYQLTDLLSLQGNLRYYKGFEAGDRGRASDLMDVSVGVRVSF
jgi:hypothetical protein